MWRLQNPRFINEFSEIDLSTLCQPTVRPRYHHQSIVEESFYIQVFIREWHVRPPQDEIVFSTAQRWQRHRGSGGHMVHLDHDVRINCTKPANDVREDRCRDRFVALELDFALRGIGQEFNVPHALLKFVESGEAAFEERVT